MATEITDLIPRTADEAKQRGLKKIKLLRNNRLSAESKSDTVQLTFANGNRRGRVCYYDPNTGAWDDCYDIA